MAFFVSFHFCKPGYEKTTLFGREGGRDISVLSLGIIELVKFKKLGVVYEFDQMIQDSASAKDIIIANAAKVRFETKRLYAKARAQARADAREQYEYWRAEVDKQTAKTHELQSQLDDARATIRTLTRLAADDQAQALALPRPSGG